MKINSFSDSLRFLTPVREKKDGQGGSSQGQYPQQNKKDSENQEPEVFEVTDQRVSDAIQSFQGDAQAQNNGLNAAIQGNGPGLRVVLKDGTGAIVRQFTGEEFLRLREAASKDTGTRGKILDQKL